METKNYPGFLVPDPFLFVKEGDMDASWLFSSLGLMIADSETAYFWTRYHARAAFNAHPELRA